MTSAYVGLGSNVGDREANLRQAVEWLRKADGVDIIRVSSIYETAPVGYLEQPDFLNAVVEIKTTLSPPELLAVTKSIEREQQRVRQVRWGPRTIDLDILLYGDAEVEEDNLRLPHPEVGNRAFVLVPLAEIAPSKRLPSGLTVANLLADLGEIEGVKLYKRTVGDRLT
jgi:2-amino-4-hydroxy-6-hydroxymethyldihydropteridine diphosphokinase